MIAYASRTGTTASLAILRDRGWRIMVSARGPLRHEGFPYALDNGAWTAHERGEPFSVPHFDRALDLLGADADFVVAPDVVAGGPASLEFSLSWLPRLAACRLVLLAVQDGMTPDLVRPHLGPRVGIFVGGTTDDGPDGGWKLRTLPDWARLARGAGAYLHVGRVNTHKRVLACSAAGADSFDGSNASRFALAKVPGLERARRQRGLGLP